MLSSLINKFKLPLTFALGGLLLVGLGVLYFKTNLFAPATKVEVLSETESPKEFVVEVAGAVEKPGVYKLPSASRIEDVLVMAGGLASDADRVWVEKNLNRAAKITDGQKIYIQQSNPQIAKNSTEDQTISPAVLANTTGLVNINADSVQKLDTLPGIGPVYAQKIIEQRPYSTMEELVSKGAISRSLYEKIKNLITLY